MRRSKEQGHARLRRVRRSLQGYQQVPRSSNLHHSIRGNGIYPSIGRLINQLPSDSKDGLFLNSENQMSFLQEFEGGPYDSSNKSKFSLFEDPESRKFKNSVDPYRLISTPQRVDSKIMTLNEMQVRYRQLRRQKVFNYH